MNNGVAFSRLSATPQGAFGWLKPCGNAAGNTRPRRQSGSGAGLAHRHGESRPDCHGCDISHRTNLSKGLRPQRQALL
jgi:hypothetical protein